MSDEARTATTCEPAGDDCSLSAAQQTRNMVSFAGLWCLIYLAAPVSYVGVTHANFLHALGESDTVANLPQAAGHRSRIRPQQFARQRQTFPDSSGPMAK